MSSRRQDAEIDISNCAVEPIHIPGSTQGRGCLFACEAGSWTISHVSANATDILGRPARELIGKPLKPLLGSALASALEAAAMPVGEGAPLVARRFDAMLKGAGRISAAMHEHDGRRIVEIEPVKEKAASAAPLDLVRGILGKLQQARTLHDLCQETADQLRDLIGYDRVMIYRFLQDGAGQVIAEARDGDLEPLLNLRYPASDIPPQARNLYKKNWVRLISDVHAAPVPVWGPGEAASRPLDLSFADLRSVSPVHIEYLKNMGVGASMSISIIVGGELWGLIACHHRTARDVPANLRAAAELLGQVFSLQIQTVEGIEAYVTMRAARTLLDRIVAEFPIDGDLINNLSSRLDQLAAFISCDGVGIWLDSTWRGTGSVPGPSEAALLARHIDQQRERGIFSTHALAEEFPVARNWRCGVRGVLAVPLSHTSSDWLFFFRNEAAQSITWGGDPTKAVTAGDGPGRISPRKSFEAWTQEVRGQSLPWTSRERLIGDTLRIYLLDIIVRFSEVIREERRQADQRQRLLSSELNHRVRGTLELIQSLIQHGFDDDTRVKSFVRTLDGRIRSIALAHNAISVANGSEVMSLMETALAQSGVRHHQVDLDGPAVKLDAKAYTVLALVVHEMVTNAVRHGALSTAFGRVAISWLIDPAGRLVVLWEEAGVSGVRRREKDGLGLVIIRRNIPHALGGESEIVFEDTGLKGSFIIPARYVMAPPVVGADREPRHQIAAPPRPLEGYSILIVEDQVTAAVDLERLLTERGAASICSVGTLEGALAAVERDPPDVAVLDFDLGDATSVPIADVLAERQIPFIFAAGEGDLQRIPAQHREAPVAGKPYSGDAVAELLKEALLPHLIRAVLTRLV